MHESWHTYEWVTSLHNSRRHRWCAWISTSLLHVSVHIHRSLFTYVGLFLRMSIKPIDGTDDVRAYMYTYTHIYIIRVTWRIHVCDMTHSYAWHDSSMPPSYVHMTCANMPLMADVRIHIHVSVCIHVLISTMHLICATTQNMHRLFAHTRGNIPRNCQKFWKSQLATRATV